MIKILIADDHPIIRHGLKLMISDEKGMIVEGEAENGNQIFDLLKNKEFDILILDLCLPDISGLEVLNRVNKIFPRIPVLILSALPEVLYAVNSIKSGARGYVNKIAAPEQLINAVKMVLSGKIYINPGLSDKVTEAFLNENNVLPHNCLSERELQIMCLLASGKTVKSISDRLILSLPTIYKYRTKIFRKMNMKNNTELIQYCINQGLLLQL
jgi:two-component system, NarL family, invasion response regulator UvrY